MADDTSNPPGPFDVHTVKSLGAPHASARFDRDRFAQRQPAHLPAPRWQHATAPLPLAPAPAVPMAAAPPTVVKAVSEPPAASSNLIEIKSPTVGTFYSRPKPDCAGLRHRRQPGHAYYGRLSDRGHENLQRRAGRLQRRDSQNPGGESAVRRVWPDPVPGRSHRLTPPFASRPQYEPPAFLRTQLPCFNAF